MRDDDAELREKLRELANQRRRFGYRRLHILLRREGVMINRKKTQRLYREEGLAKASSALTKKRIKRFHLGFPLWRKRTRPGVQRDRDLVPLHKRWLDLRISLDDLLCYPAQLLANF